MATAEKEVTIEIICTHLPGAQWADRGPVHLGIQRGAEVIEATLASRDRIVFRPKLRVRPEEDGSANFLGPYTHGPRTERFIYMNWVIVRNGEPVEQCGRIKLHLNHISWKDVQNARRKPLKVTLQLTNAKGKPVFASVRADKAQWEL